MDRIRIPAPRKIYAYNMGTPLSLFFHFDVSIPRRTWQLLSAKSPGTETEVKSNRGTHQQRGPKLSGEPVFRAVAPPAHLRAAGRRRCRRRVFWPALRAGDRRDRMGLRPVRFPVRSRRFFPVQWHDAGAVSTCLYPHGIYISSPARLQIGQSVRETHGAFEYEGGPED